MQKEPARVCLCVHAFVFPRDEPAQGLARPKYTRRVAPAPLAPRETLLPPILCLSSARVASPRQREEPGHKSSVSSPREYPDFQRTSSSLAFLRRDRVRASGNRARLRYGIIEIIRLRAFRVCLCFRPEPFAIAPLSAAGFAKRERDAEARDRSRGNTETRVAKGEEKKKKERRGELMRRHCSRLGHIREQRYRHLHLQFKRFSPGIVCARRRSGVKGSITDRLLEIDLTRFSLLHLGQGARRDFSFPVVSTTGPDRSSLSISAALPRDDVIPLMRNAEQPAADENMLRRGLTFEW